MHRCLTEGELEPAAGEFPLNHAVLGGKQLYKGTDTTAVLVRPDMSRFIADALSELDQDGMRPKFMALACHPYLSGVPHRISHVERTFAEILSHDGVVAWDGSKILDWYLTEGRMRDAA